MGSQILTLFGVFSFCPARVKIKAPKNIRKGDKMKKLIALILTVLTLAGIVSASAAAFASEVYFGGIVSTQSGNLNVRSQPSTSSAVISSAAKNSLLTIVGEQGGFYRVQYATDSYGYCSKTYIKAVSQLTATVNTADGNLNVRHGTSTSYAVKDRLPKGTKVVILEEYGNWAKILYHGSKTGFVSCAYLKKSTQGFSAVSLAVPSFKQTDSRWASVIIGSSGKTIGKIGCATTGIAMMESYRRGYSIYPDRMSRLLSYSSSGNVYWPSDYKVTTSSENYLQKIYEILASGKPVLFGSKNYYGSQHWVVITGFKGGSLSAESFTINDPGSSSRVLLSQFISAYPVFYKYFSY